MKTTQDGTQPSRTVIISYSGTNFYAAGHIAGTIICEPGVLVLVHNGPVSSVLLCRGAYDGCAIRDQQMLPRPASTVLVHLRLSDLRLRLPGRISLRNSSGLLNIPPSSLHDLVTIPRLLVFIAFYIHTPRVPDKAPHRGVVVKLLPPPALPIPSVLCSPKPTMRQDPSSPVTAFRYDQ